MKDADIQSIIHCINLLGEDLIGAEIGVFKAESFCSLLIHCKNIKKLYGIDFWQSYTDFLKEPYDGKPAYTISDTDIKIIRNIAFANIKKYDIENKSIIVEKDSSLASLDFDDNFFDFVFVDTYMDFNQCSKDLEDWYPKVKPKGIFSGHDWNSDVVQLAVYKFRKKYNIKSKMSTFDNTFIWIK